MIEDVFGGLLLAIVGAVIVILTVRPLLRRRRQLRSPDHQLRVARADQQRAMERLRRIDQATTEDELDSLDQEE